MSMIGGNVLSIDSILIGKGQSILSWVMLPIGLFNAAMQFIFFSFLFRLKTGYIFDPIVLTVSDDR